MNEKEIRSAFEDAGAILSGHFTLTSGRHADTYVQCARVLEDVALTTSLAVELVARVDDTSIDLVVAPAVGGIVIGFAVAQAQGTPFIFSEREQGEMRLRRGFTVPSGSRVLIVEDVVTTGGSVAEVAALVEGAGGEVVCVASLIDRGGPKAFGHDLVSLLAVDVPSWEPDACPLCAAGVPTVSPGSRRLDKGLA